MSLVEIESSTGSATTSVTVTLPDPVAILDSVIVGCVVRDYGFVNPRISASDSLGDGFLENVVTNQTVPTVSNFSVAILTATADVSGSDNVTCSSSEIANFEVDVLVVSGINVTVFVTGSNESEGFGMNASEVPIDLIVGAPFDSAFLFGVGDMEGGPSSCSAGSGFTKGSLPDDEYSNLVPFDVNGTRLGNIGLYTNWTMVCPNPGYWAEVGIGIGFLLTPVTVVETGLPGGTDWAVLWGGVDGANITITTTSTAFLLNNYANTQFIVPAVSSGTPMTAWIPTPSSGTVYPLGFGITITIHFTLEGLHHVLFLEHNLLLGKAWSVTANFVTQTATLTCLPPPWSMPCGNVIGFSEPSGPLNFSITPPADVGIASVTGKGIVSQTSGVVGPGNPGARWTVNFGILIPLYFEVYPVPPVEPYHGAEWSVSLLPAVQRGGPSPLSNYTNGTSPAGTNVTTVGFLIPAGAAYKFSITGPGPEYRIVPSTGLVRSGSTSSQIQELVKFILLTSFVKFKETGLARGTDWSVTILDGTSPAVHYPVVESGPGPQQLAFHLPAGTYGWVANAPGSSAAPIAGTLLVSYPSAPTRVNVAFGAAKAYGCFYFTDVNGVPIGVPICNGNVDINDFLVNFTQLPAPTVCASQFALGGSADGPPEACPNAASAPANQLEVNWSNLVSPPAITSCYWAVSGTPTGTCTPPAPAPNGFVLSVAQITSVAWTAYNHEIGPPILAPLGAYGVVFLL